MSRAASSVPTTCFQIVGTLLAAILVFMTHYGVNEWAAIFPDPDKAFRWIQFVMRAPEMIVFTLVALVTVNRWREPWRGVMGFVAIVAIMEETEIGVCGTQLFNTVPSSLKLCTAAYGPLPNLIIAATALTLWFIIGQRREHQEPL